VRVLVLPRTLHYSDHVLRIFDFLTANLVTCNGDEKAYGQGHTTYIDKWFRSEGPAALLCGPNSDLFGKLVKERLSLPTRLAGFPGFYLRNGRIFQSTHTVVEVYLPDQKKFVMFDLNNSFVVRWKNAVELAKIVNSRVGPDARLTPSEAARLKLDIYTGVPRKSRPGHSPVLCAGGAVSVGAKHVTDVPVERDWWEKMGLVHDPPCWLALHLAGASYTGPLNGQARASSVTLFS
jgi:hypothetical protein